MKLLLAIAIMQICQTLSNGFSAFSSQSTSSTPATNSSKLMDIKLALLQDYTDATDSEVTRFVTAYEKNGVDAFEKKEGERILVHRRKVNKPDNLS